MQIYWHKRKCLHKKRIQLPQDWFGTLTWPPFRCLRHQYGRRDVMWKHSFNDPIDSTVVTQPLLIGVTLDQWHQKTYVYHSCVFTGKRKKNSCFFFPSMQCSQSWCWTKRCSPVPWVPEDTFSYRYWWFAAKPRQRGAKRQEKRMTSGHRSYESHFHSILGSYYVIKTVWSWCACLFSLTLTAEMWSYMTLCLICLRADVSYFLCCVPFPRATKEIGDVCTQATSDLLCMKKELRESLLKKERAIKNCHKFFSKKIHFRFQVYKKDRSQLRSTHSVWF